MESTGTRKGIGHKVALWGMIVPTALITFPHLFPIPMMLYVGTLTLKKIGVLTILYTAIAVSWKAIMVFDETQSWSKKGMIAAGWTILFVGLMESPCVGKTSGSFIYGN